MSSEAYSREVYERELAPWLPPRIVDIHSHVCLPEHMGPVSPERLAADWARQVGIVQSWEELRSNYGLLFPRREVHSLVFGTPLDEVDLEANNRYILTGRDGRTDVLFLTRPEYDASAITHAMEQGFRGIKPYPDLARKGHLEVSIYEFLPPEQLAALDEAGGILMLHLPREGRLRDPDNIREVLELHERYPRVRVIIAHVGRAYALPTAERGLPHFADAPGIMFDISANLNAEVFGLALDIVGADRLLFGSDLPITLMRGVREYAGDDYINYTDGDYSWNVNRKRPEEEAMYTYYLYEELRALKRALEEREDEDAAEKIMWRNGARLLGLD